MPDEPRDDDTDRFWPWREGDPPPPLRAHPPPAAPWAQAPEPERLPRPPRRPTTAPRARSAPSRDRVLRQRPSLAAPQGRQRVLDIALLVLAVVVVILVVLALQG